MLRLLKESDFAVEVVHEQPSWVPQPKGLDLKKQAVPAEAEIIVYLVVFIKSH